MMIRFDSDGNIKGTAKVGWVEGRLGPDYVKDLGRGSPNTHRVMFFDTDDKFNSAYLVKFTPSEKQDRVKELALVSVRRDRDKLLKETDYITLRAYDAGESVPKKWADYRQDLRDLPSTADSEGRVVWPGKPE